MARGIGFFVFDKIGIIGDGIDDAPTIDSLMNLARHQVIDGFGGRGGLRFGVPVGMKFLWYFQGQDFSYAIDRFVLVGAKMVRPAGYLGMHPGPAEIFGGDDFPGGHLHQGGPPRKE